MNERSEILEMMAVLQLSVCGQLVLGGGVARKLLAALSACLDLLHIQVEPAPARQARRAHSRQEHEGRRHCVGPSAVRPAEVWYNADETYQIVIRFMRNVALGLQLLPRPVTTI